MKYISDMLATLYIVFLLISYVTYSIWMSQNATIDYSTEMIFIIIIGIFFAFSFVAFGKMADKGGVLIPAAGVFLIYTLISGLTIYKATKKMQTNGARYRNTALVFGMLAFIPAVASFFTSEKGSERLPANVRNKLGYK